MHTINYFNRALTA